ncbi:hypothetical protein Mal4_40080 [Maioricimonas rarisocia]|uniref:Uncharacterized protein n=1 Tax=Maioricimonas rarisocia TaxID=2528026 RepID=A0A517ZAZ0_9PLAN|nr:hypothetical protein [Maioricimonas rarisocia]QDU39662.1 hypothetical protein Mal4_40080 [Maioricimonas rarisocia]
MPACPTATIPPRVRVAIGPERPGIGSWDWVGQDLAESLQAEFAVSTFRDEVPACDVAVLVKQPPSVGWGDQLPAGVRLIDCPIDRYGSAGEIDADWRLLRRASRVVAHSPLLARYFCSYARVEVLDHHLKYSIRLRESFLDDGPLLWTGVWLNLRPLVDWVNRHTLPAELHVLTNFEGHACRSAGDFGFRARNRVRVSEWTPARHATVLRESRGAIDIKGEDFRARHKPAAKAMDVLASGVPLAMNLDSSSARVLQQRGFQLAAPHDFERWLSRDYWEQTRDFGRMLQETLTLPRIAGRFADIVRQVLAEEQHVDAA